MYKKFFVYSVKWTLGLLPQDYSWETYIKPSGVLNQTDKCLILSTINLQNKSKGQPRYTSVDYDYRPGKLKCIPGDKPREIPKENINRKRFR